MSLRTFSCQPATTIRKTLVTVDAAQIAFRRHPDADDVVVIGLALENIDPSVASGPGHQGALAFDSGRRFVAGQIGIADGLSHSVDSGRT